MGRGGVEPPTFHFSGGRSYQLSYLPKRRERYNSTARTEQSGITPRVQLLVVDAEVVSDLVHLSLIHI